MLTDLKRWIASRHVVAATLVCATALMLLAASETYARSGNGAADIVFVNGPQNTSGDGQVARSIETFIAAMANHDADAVWMFASEEDQDAFGTEKAVYAAYQETFPAFAGTRQVTFTRFWTEGDTPFAEVLLSGGSGPASVARMGLWLDDAGDWKLVSCEIKPVSDIVAGL